MGLAGLELLVGCFFYPGSLGGGKGWFTRFPRPFYESQSVHMTTRADRGI